MYTLIVSDVVSVSLEGPSGKLQQEFMQMPVLITLMLQVRCILYICMGGYCIAPYFYSQMFL